MTILTMSYHGSFQNGFKRSSLTTSFLQGEATKRLSDQFRLKMQGSFKPRDVYRQLLYISSEKTSINNVSNKFKRHNTKFMCRTSMETHVGKMAKIEYLLQKQESLLGKGIFERILGRNKAYDFAIDFHDVPYYGKIVDENVEYIVRSKAKKGTTKFYRYASLSCLKKNKHLTLSVIPVKKGEKKPDTLEHLLSAVDHFNLRVKCLFLDREFYAVKTLQYLYSTGLPFIMPAVRKGKSGGIRKFEKGNKSYSARYLLGAAKFEIPIHVIVFYEKGRKEKHGRNYRMFTSNNIDWPPKKIATQYKKRFGIESSYRQLNMLKAMTTSRKPGLRYLYVLLAFMLCNIWMVRPLLSK